MTDVIKKNKIKYCKSSLEHLTDDDKKKVLYQIYNSYEQTDNEKVLRSIFSENAVGTILDLDNLSIEGLDILYLFIKKVLNE